MMPFILNLDRCDHGQKRRIQSTLRMKPASASTDKTVRQLRMAQLRCPKRQVRCHLSQSNPGPLITYKCLHHRQNHNYKEDDDSKKTANDVPKPEELVIDEAKPIPSIPAVDPKGEGNAKNEVKVVTEVSEIGDVRQQLTECVVSVQNKIFDTLLVGVLSKKVKKFKT